MTEHITLLTAVLKFDRQTDRHYPVARGFIF